MARFVKGDVIVGMFPLSNATGAKSRPALVLSSWAYTSQHASGYAYLLSAISATSKTGADPFTFELRPADIVGGSLNKQSFLCPSYLFSADENAITRKVGVLKPATFETVLQVIKMQVLTSS